MTIHFTQSGGFAGLTRACVLDTAMLPPDERAQLEQLIKASGLSSSSAADATRGEEASFSLSSSGRDYEQYEIAIDQGEGPPIAVTHDRSTLPAAARPLIGFLKKYATPATPR